MRVNAHPMPPRFCAKSDFAQFMKLGRAYVQHVNAAGVKLTPTEVEQVILLQHPVREAPSANGANGDIFWALYLQQLRLTMDELAKLPAPVVDVNADPTFRACVDMFARLVPGLAQTARMLYYSKTYVGTELLREARYLYGPEWVAKHSAALQTAGSARLASMGYEIAWPAAAATSYNYSDYYGY